MSGIAAASKLMEKGYETITILEAEDRIGGRIHSVPIDDKFIDLGAQWFYGVKGNEIYELAKDTFDFVISEFDQWNITYLLSNGSAVDEIQSTKISVLAYDIMRQSEKDTTYKGSLGDYFFEKFKSQLKDSEYSDVDPTLANLISESVKIGWKYFIGSPSLHDISVQLNAQYYDYFEEKEGIDVLWRDKGFKTVLDYITVRLQIRKSFQLIFCFFFSSEKTPESFRIPEC